MSPQRSLSEEEIQAIAEVLFNNEDLAEAIFDRATERFYQNLGRGLLALFWRGLLAVLIGIAAYGAYKG